MSDFFEQKDLSRLSGHYYDFAGTILGRDLSQDALNISAIGRRADRSLSMLTNQKGEAEKPLWGFELLQEIGLLGRLSGSSRETSRANVVLVARVGGRALQQIHERAKTQGVRMSSPALGGLHRFLNSMHNEMHGAFEPVIRPHGTDQEAFGSLLSAAEVLAKRSPIVLAAQPRL